MFWNKLWELLEFRAEVPAVGGWLHLAFWVASIAAGVLLCRWLKDGKKYAPRVVSLIAVLVVLLEVYKLVHFSLIRGDGAFSFSWYHFPFQFCSTPMYVGLLVVVFPKGPVRDSLYAYLATFAVFAGLCVMLYPAQVFSPYVLINVQTMVCHGTMLTVGIYLYGSGCVKAEFKTVLKALPIFIVAVVIAIALNEWAHVKGLTENYYFNMFYFSPHGKPYLVLYSNVQKALGVSNPLNIVIYVLGFTGAACGVMLGAKGIGRLCSRRKSKAKVTIQ